MNLLFFHTKYMTKIPFVKSAPDKKSKKFMPPCPARGNSGIRIMFLSGLVRGGRPTRIFLKPAERELERRPKKSFRKISDPPRHGSLRPHTGGTPCAFSCFFRACPTSLTGRMFFKSAAAPGGCGRRNAVPGTCQTGPSPKAQRMTVVSMSQARPRASSSSVRSPYVMEK